MLDEVMAWRALLAIRDAVQQGRDPEDALPKGPLTVHADGSWSFDRPVSPAAAVLLDLYLPLCVAGQDRSYLVAHLGQSLDGRIAATNGASRWVTGEADITHNHRMRALFDAVLVGAGTIRLDDPMLTVRHCLGPNPVRVVVDTNRRLDGSQRVFRDGLATTLLMVAEDQVGSGRLERAEVVGLPRRGDGLDCAVISAELKRRGIGRVFIEGGGITVSRFLGAGILDRLQITISPLIIGSGRPSLSLPEIQDLAEALRPRTRRFDLDPDIMIECIFND